eukprot:3293610-Rhodomonas_salina.1
MSTTTHTEKRGMWKSGKESEGERKKERRREEDGRGEEEGRRGEDGRGRGEGERGRVEGERKRVRGEGERGSVEGERKRGAPRRVRMTHTKAAVSVLVAPYPSQYS